MRILVTSGNGLTGSWLRFLSNKLNNHQFIFHDRNLGDLTNIKVTKKIINNLSPDIIIHNAAELNGALDKLSEKKKSASNNLVVFDNLIESVRNNQKVYCFSSYHVYQGDAPFKELNINSLNYSSPYSGWKSSEIQSTKNLSNFNYILFPHLFGPYDNFKVGRAHFVADSIRRICFAMNKKDHEIEFHGDKNQVIQLATGEQAAEFTLNQIQYDYLPDTNYIRANIGWKTKTELVFNALLNIMEFKGSVVNNSNPILQTNRNMYFENETSISNVIPNDFYESLFETVNYFKKTLE
jgi:nucleoside-diphosphate-sugar epimerase